MRLYQDAVEYRQGTELQCDMATALFQTRRPTPATDCLLFSHLGDVIGVFAVTPADSGTVSFPQLSAY